MAPGRVFDKEIFGLGSSTNTVFALIIIGLLIPAGYFTWKANNQNGAQNKYLWWLEDSIITNNTELQGFIISNATAINTTVASLSVRVTNIENVLNMTENTAIMTINGITAEMTNQNFDLIAGDNIVLTPDAMTHSITIEANVPGGGITDVTSTDMSITVDITNSTVDLSNNGVTAVNGMSGSIFLLGKDGIEVTANSSSVNICAPGITTAIMNLQQEDANQAMQIMAIETKNDEQDVEIEALKTAGMTIQDMLNNTDMDVDMFNMTLLALITQVNMLQMQVDSLQMQVDNITAASAPTGALLPWTGTAGSVPDGFLYCDGTQYPFAAYNALNMVIGTMYCDGGCAPGMFAVPDMREHVPVGFGAGGPFSMLGSYVGENTHTLAETEMPTHMHSGSVGDGGNHNHNGATLAGTPHSHDMWVSRLNGQPPIGQNLANIGGTTTCPDNIKQMTTPSGFAIQSDGLVDIAAQITGVLCGRTAPVDESAHTHPISSDGTTHGHSIPPSGDNQPHSIVQKSTVVNYMIKT